MFASIEQNVDNFFVINIDFAKIKTIIFDTTGSDFIQSTERL